MEVERVNVTEKKQENTYAIPEADGGNGHIDKNVNSLYSSNISKDVPHLAIDQWKEFKSKSCMLQISVFITQGAKYNHFFIFFEQNMLQTDNTNPSIPDREWVSF